MEADAAREIRIAAALLLRANGDTLVVRKRGTQVFMQPGGKVEPGETSLQALIREVREELGIGLDLFKIMPLGRFEAEAAHESGRIVVADVFAVEIDIETIQPAAEIEEARWISPWATDDIALAALTRDRILPFHRDRQAQEDTNPPEHIDRKPSVRS